MLWRTPRQYDSVVSLHIAAPESSRQGLQATGVDMEAQSEFAHGVLVLSTALSQPQITQLPLLRWQRSPIDFVRSQMRASSNLSTGELRLSLSSNDPTDAKAILDAVASAFVVASRARAPQGAPLDVSIVMPAQTLSAVTWPRPIPVISIAALAGLLLGSMLACLVDAAAVQPLDPIDAAMTVRAPLLGCVPRLPRSLTTPALRGQSILVNSSAALEGEWNQVMKALDSVFVANFDKTILFTAAGKARGKTLLASNMAIALAQAGHRVVLVDGHPDRAAVAEIFGIENAVGLADVVDGRADLNSVLRITGLRGLEVLPAGIASGSWRQLLNGQNFIDVLSDLSERFDRVLIDGGPAASDECRILGAYCDISVLVADGRVGSRRELRSAAEGLRNVGARLAGIVWNRSPRQIAALSSLAKQIRSRERETPPSSGDESMEPASVEGASEERMESALVPYL